MIKQNEITSVNVDDFIRERKKAGAKYIRWSKKGKGHKYIIQFCKAIADSNNYGYSWIKSGMSFKGVKHYWK